MQQKTYTKQLLAGLALLAVFMIGLRWWVFQKKEATITSFEACAALDGSVIQESFPEVCITKDRQQFVAPTPVVTTIVPSPTPPAPLITLYSSPWYRFEYPGSWTVLEQDHNILQEQSLIIFETRTPGSTESGTLSIAMNRPSESSWLESACVTLTSSENMNLSEVITGTVKLYDVGMLTDGSCVYDTLTGASLSFSNADQDYLIDYVQDLHDVVAAKDFERILLSFESVVASESGELRP